jgi:DNA-binding transcriptional MerR regulator
MAEILQKVAQLQAQGMQDADIIKQLQAEGVPPKDIGDAINQVKIKQAVGPEQTTPTQDMQQSIMQPQEQQMQQALPAEQIQQQTPMQTPQEQAAYDQAYYQTPQAYPQQAYYPQAGGFDTETISEIADQIVTEKLQEQNEKTGDISAFKSSTEEQLENLSQRLEQIEASIEQLQQAVIAKIGEFGQTGEYIKKDLNNLHNTVSKLMNPLIDNYKELKKISKGK